MQGVLYAGDKGLWETRIQLLNNLLCHCSQTIPPQGRVQGGKPQAVTQTSTRTCTVSVHETHGIKWRHANSRISDRWSIEKRSTHKSDKQSRLYSKRTRLHREIVTTYGSQALSLPQNHTHFLRNAPYSWA